MFLKSTDVHQRRTLHDALRAMSLLVEHATSHSFFSLTWILFDRTVWLKV